MKYVYNNVLSKVTFKVVKNILKFNVLQYIFLEMGINYKIVAILLIILI